MQEPAQKHSNAPIKAGEKKTTSNARFKILTYNQLYKYFMTEETYSTLMLDLKDTLSMFW